MKINGFDSIERFHYNSYILLNWHTQNQKLANQEIYEHQIAVLY